MNDFQYDPIKPADVPLSRPEQPVPPGPASPPSRRRKPGPGVALLGLGALVFVVLFLLPHWIEPTPRPVESDIATPAEAEAKVSAATAEPAPVPEDDARQTAARRETQAVLTRLTALQQELEQHGVTIWAAIPHEQALEQIASGDARYRQRDFVSALEHYRQAERTLTAVQADRDVHLQQALADGAAALERGDAEAAAGHFERALIINPENTIARQGLVRLEQLPGVLTALERAVEHERNGDLTAALAGFEAALALDEETLAARQGRDRLRQAITRERYQNALNQGFAALQSGDDAGAQQAFRAALAAQPGDDVARSGLAQAKERAAHRELTTALQQARDLEQQEHWTQAEQIYSRLNDRDPALIDARVGRLRATARAQLDRDIEQLLADPLSPGSEALVAQSRELLEQARAIAQPGPRLTRQGLALERLLQQAGAVATVSLRSDNRTHVTVLRVTDLGRLQATKLSLRPGRYVATGSRSGYRDVRVEFEVPLGSSAVAVEVICHEPIRL